MSPKAGHQEGEGTEVVQPGEETAVNNYLLEIVEKMDRTLLEDA